MSTFWQKRNAFNFGARRTGFLLQPYQSVNWFSPGFNMTQYGFSIWFYVFCIRPRRARLLPRGDCAYIFCTCVRVCVIFFTAEFIYLRERATMIFSCSSSQALEVEIFYCGSIYAFFSFLLKVHTCTRLRKAVGVRERVILRERADLIRADISYSAPRAHLHSHQIHSSLPGEKLNAATRSLSFERSLYSRWYLCRDMRYWDLKTMDGGGKYILQSIREPSRAIQKSSQMPINWSFLISIIFFQHLQIILW